MSVSAPQRGSAPQGSHRGTSGHLRTDLHMKSPRDAAGRRRSCGRTWHPAEHREQSPSPSPARRTFISSALQPAPSAPIPFCSHRHPISAPGRLGLGEVGRAGGDGYPPAAGPRWFPAARAPRRPLPGTHLLENLGTVSRAVESRAQRPRSGAASLPVGPVRVGAALRAPSPQRKPALRSPRSPRAGWHLVAPRWTWKDCGLRRESWKNDRGNSPGRESEGRARREPERATS